MVVYEVTKCIRYLRMIYKKLPVGVLMVKKSPRIKVWGLEA